MKKQTIYIFTSVLLTLCSSCKKDDPQTELQDSFASLRLEETVWEGSLSRNQVENKVRFQFIDHELGSITMFKRHENNYENEFLYTKGKYGTLFLGSVDSIRPLPNELANMWKVQKCEGDSLVMIRYDRSTPDVLRLKCINH